MDIQAHLRDVESQVQTGMKRSRQLRGWLLWLLWLILGGALTLRVIPTGTWLSVAVILTGPFWLLFVAWPGIWLYSQVKARRLWAQDVSLIICSEVKPAVAIAVISSKKAPHLLVSLQSWLQAFPSLTPQALALEVYPSSHYEGVDLETLDAQALMHRLEGDDPTDERVTLNDWFVAKKWYRHLFEALRAAH